MDTLKVYVVSAVVAALTACLFSIWAFPAKAGEANWTGCSIGVAGSLKSATGEGLGADGKGVAPSVGCDLQSQRFIFGVWADYDWSSYNWGGDNIDTKGWAAGGRAGVVVIPNVLAYAKLGYTELKAGDLGDLNGMVYGGGLELALRPNVFTSLEYRYEPLSVSDCGGCDLKNQEVRLGLSYKFGWSEADRIPSMLDTAAKPLK